MTDRLREALHAAAVDVPAYPVYERSLATARRYRRRTTLTVVAALMLIALAGTVLPLARTPAVDPAAGADAALPDQVGVPPFGSLHATDWPPLGPASVIFTGQAPGLMWGEEGSIIAVVGADTDRYRIIKGEIEAQAGEDTVLSPDGRRIAFRSISFLRAQVEVIDLVTGRSRTVTSGVSDTVIAEPAGWSPDGRALVVRDTVRGERRGGAFLSTEHWEGGTVINVHGDGGSRGKPQPRAAARAGRTVLSTVTTNDYPTILAARREMQSWRRLALEPSALRTPDGFTDSRSLGVDGRHLAATLYRIANEPVGNDTDVDPDAVYARVAGRLSDLVGVGVRGVMVELDPIREVFTLFLQEKGDLRLPARALSEGTLRFLALCVLLEDPTFTGLICMEEPENGIHSANLPAMLELVQDLAIDLKHAPGDTNSFRQVIVNTHAPGVVQRCDPSDLLLADVKPQISPSGSVTRALSLLPFRESWRATGDQPTFSEADIVAYLVAPPGAQLRLPLLTVA